MRKLIMWVLAALAVASTLSITPAAPAAADVIACSGVEPVYCDIAYRKYSSGGVTRSSVDGFIKGFTHRIGWNDDADFIEGKVYVQDLADSDGWRARVWVNLYRGCYCINREWRVGDWRFDGHTVKATPWDLVWHAAGEPDRFEDYTLQVIVGRYKGSTGACEPLDLDPFKPGCGEYSTNEQRFYFRID